MSVSLYRYSGDINDEKSVLILSENVASESFYQKYWVKAISSSDVTIFKDGAEFDVNDINVVISDLESLKIWAAENLSDKTLEHMTSRIENLEIKLKKSRKIDGGKFYIF